MMSEPEPIDFEAIAKLGIVDESALDTGEDLSNDPVLAAELAALMGGKSTGEKRATENLKAKVTELKRQALQLKRNGDAVGALAKLREAKELEAAPAQHKDAAMNALAEVAINTSSQADRTDDLLPIDVGIDDEDSELMAEMAALSGEKEIRKARGGIPPAPKKPALKPAPCEQEASSPSIQIPSGPVDLKKKALAFKRAGDLEKAMECLRQAKAIEAGDAALERVRIVTERQAAAAATKNDTKHLWREFANAVDKAMREAVRDAKTRLSKGESEAAKEVTARARELKSTLEAVSANTFSEPPPSFHWIQVTAASRKVDINIEENQALLRIERLRFPADASTKLTKFRIEWEFAGGRADSRETNCELAKNHIILGFIDKPCQFQATLDAGIVAARRLLLTNESARMNIQERRRFEAARRAVAKFGRSKLIIRVFASSAGLFRHRESLVGSTYVRLEPLLNSASIQDTVKIRPDPDSTLLTKPGQVDIHIRLREPLQTPEIVQALCRNDIVIQGSLPSSITINATSDEETVATTSNSTTRKTPPDAECKNPLAPNLIVSDKVLDHEIAIAEKAAANGGDITANARRLALATTQQLLIAEVQSGKLTPSAYATRVQERRQADLLLATWLNSHDRKSDAARVLERIKLADSELAELREAGEI